jgi:hypothetical protein
MNNTPPDQLPSTEKSITPQKIKARDYSLFDKTKKMPSSESSEEGTKKDDTNENLQRITTEKFPSKESQKPFRKQSMT